MISYCTYFITHLNQIRFESYFLCFIFDILSWNFTLPPGRALFFYLFGGGGCVCVFLYQSKITTIILKQKKIKIHKSHKSPGLYSRPSFIFKFQEFFYCFRATNALIFFFNFLMQLNNRNVYWYKMTWIRLFEHIKTKKQTKSYCYWSIFGFFTSVKLFKRLWYRLSRVSVIFFCLEICRVILLVSASSLPTTPQVSTWYGVFHRKRFTVCW